MDRNDPRFATEVEVLAVRAPRSAVGGLMAKLRRHTLARPRLNRVQHLDDDHSLVLLDAASCPVDGDRDALPPNVLDALASCGGTHECQLVTHRVILGYDDLDVDECLRRVLPADVTVPRGFETAGRIAHLNLRDEHEPWKRVIAAVLIDKLPQIETVVNKTGETGGPFRTFAMEVLAGRGGDGPLETTVSENGLVYDVDFRGMYWNSRLGTERARLVDSFDENDVVLDLCCGVGPIALPASKKCLAVYANDLNPAAVAYLERNARRNKGTSLAGVTNLDAGECLRMRIAEFETVARGESTFDEDERDVARKRFTRVVMNLPQGSLELLPCFVGAFDRETWPPEFLPVVDVYAFSKSDDPEADAGAHCAKELGLEEDAAALGPGLSALSPAPALLVVTAVVLGLVTFPFAQLVEIDMSLYAVSVRRRSHLSPHRATPQLSHAPHPPIDAGGDGAARAHHPPRHRARAPPPVPHPAAHAPLLSPPPSSTRDRAHPLTRR